LRIGSADEDAQHSGTKNSYNALFHRLFSLAQ